MTFIKFTFLKKNRISTVFYNSLYSGSSLLWTILFSYIVIQQTSVNLWGEFMAIVAVVTFGAHIVKWGNKTYLLKEYSKKPSHIKSTWNEVFFARSPIYLIISSICILVNLDDLKLAFFLFLWILSDYIFSSIEAHIIYFKKFKFFFILELCLISIAVVVLYTNKISLNLMIALYVIRILVKGITSLLLFRDKLGWSFQNPSLLILKNISPFFIIGLIGLLNSKLDFYAILFYLNEDDIGKYHVLSNFVLFGITIGSYIIIPFEKNIYRLKKKKVKLVALNFLILGILISCSWMFISKIIISKIYGINFPISIFLIGIIYILPIYYYWPLLHKLYSENKTVSTIKIGLLSVLINALFIFVLLPKYGIAGALISAAIGQMVHLIGYIILSKR